jgi:hypothetical protein
MSYPPTLAKSQILGDPEALCDHSDIFSFFHTIYLFREMAMNTRSFILILATTLLSGPSAAADQFVCIFGDRVKFDAAKLKNPTAKIVPSSERYTFIRETPETATYIPPDGIGGKVFAHENSEVLTFIEKNRSSNLFVVTIFKGKKNLTYKAAYTLHGSPDDHPHFFPHTSLGECQHFEMTPPDHRQK